MKDSGSYKEKYKARSGRRYLEGRISEAGKSITGSEVSVSLSSVRKEENRGKGNAKKKPVNRMDK